MNERETGTVQTPMSQQPADHLQDTRWRDWSLTLKNLFLPIFCKSCSLRLLTEENGFFCPTCWEASPRIERPFCSRCGRPHPGMVGLGSRANYPCADCREHPDPHINRIYGAALFDGAVAQAVKLLKFYGRERIASPLAELMSEFAAQEMEVARYDLVVPVPLHRVRQRDRGFNQAALLAAEVMPSFPEAELIGCLERIRPTRTQSKLNGKARQANVRGAFAVRGDTCGGKRILLIDDVVTTAGTVAECAAALCRAGAVHVDVLAAALADDTARYQAQTDV